MRIKALIVLSLLLHVFSAQSQQFNWVTSVTGEGYEYGIKSTKDADGNTYILGYSIGDTNNSNSFTFNGVSYPTIGRGDVFFAKLDTNKQLVWMKTIGGDDYVYYDEAHDIHVDVFGNIYIAFKAAGFNVTYNGQTLSGVGSIGQYGGEGVLLKVNSNGDYLWHDSGTLGSLFNKITTDSNGNLYVTGYFRSSITLGGTLTLTNPSTDTTTDMLLAKYQPNGTLVWAKRAGGMPHNTFAYGIDLKINPQTNQLIVLALGEGYVYFDGVLMPFNEFTDRGKLLISYTLDGSQNWIKRIMDEEDLAYSNLSSIAISASGIIGVVGNTSGSTTDGLVGFYTSDGTIIHEHLYPSNYLLRVTSIDFNEFNEAYIAGSSYGETTLGVSPATATLSGHKGFIAKLDVLHQIKWVASFDASAWSPEIKYNQGKLLFASRIDSNFIYNSGQNTIVTNEGDAVYGEMTDYQLPRNRCDITGTIFQDLEGNCILNTTDIPQNAVLVKATDTNGIDHFSISDSMGYYDIPVTTGTYTVTILPNPIQSSLITQNCYSQQNVILQENGQDVDEVNFPMELANCALLTVDLSSDRRRRCFDSNTYVRYTNSGFAQAENVQVIVELPEYVTLISSDHSYTTNALGQYVFSIGTLTPNQSGVIHIVDHTECVEGITGITQCTQAWINPANDCANVLDPNYLNWDKSFIIVKGDCTNTTQAEFTIFNTSQPGFGDMGVPREYRIYVDNALALTSTFQLNGGQNTVINYPANGQTIRLEADQHPLYSGNSYAQKTIEGCGSAEESITYGLVNTMSMGDDDVTTEIDCLTIIDSFDPNDKLVSPTGITANNYVKAGTLLEYMIRFQNTGTDTAYKVVIKDTLSAHLDPSTIQWGISSHPYTIAITGTQTPILEFTFNNINLPHSAANEPASHGFVKFKAASFSTLENGIEVDNNANIYFDYNVPILTNTVQITISDFVPTHEPLAVNPFTQQKISVYPNPTTGLLVIETDTLQQVEIYTIHGILIEVSDKNQINLNPYAKGIYLVKITTDKGIALKKVILK